MGWIVWLIVSILLLVLLVVFLALLGCVFAKLVTNPAKNTKDELMQIQVERNEVDYEDFDKYNKEDFMLFSLGIEIRGSIIYATRPSNKWVIIAHGFTVSSINSIKYVKVFMRLGFNCVIYDQRYFGESGGTFCSLGYYESQDLVNIVNYVKEKFGEDIFLALHGESMGAVTALCALTLTDKVNCVIADCPFADTRKYLAHCVKQLGHLLSSFPVLGFLRWRIRSQYKFDIFKVSPIKAVEQTYIPILFFHGVADTLIDRSNSIELYNKCKNPLSRICLVPDVEHASSHRADKNKYRETIGSFIADIGISIETK